MIDTSIALDKATEAHEIHNASCRYRRQGLVCSTCHELAERAERAARFPSASLGAGWEAA